MREPREFFDDVAVDDSPAQRIAVQLLGEFDAEILVEQFFRMREKGR